MKSPEQTADRLLRALEDFAAREVLLLRAGDYEAFAAIQRRETPLVVRLCQLGAETAGAVTELGSRVSALLAKRSESLALIAERKTFLFAERGRMAAVRERLSRVAPYSRVASPRGVDRRRLNAAV